MVREMQNGRYGNSMMLSTPAPNGLGAPVGWRATTGPREMDLEFRAGGGLIFQIVLLARDARSTRISVFLCEQEGEQRVSPSEWSVGRIRRFC